MKIPMLLKILVCGTALTSIVFFDKPWVHMGSTVETVDASAGYRELVRLDSVSVDTVMNASRAQATQTNFGAESTTAQVAHTNSGAGQTGTQTTQPNSNAGKKPKTSTVWQSTQNGTETYLKWKNPLKITRLKKLFEDSVIVGDSVVEAASDYDVLYNNELIHSRGASVCDARPLLNKAINMRPKRIFLVFGLNDTEYYRADTERCVAEYTKQIRYIQKKLPQCEIYVNCVNPVLPRAVKSKKPLKYINKYNRAFKRMCRTNKVTFVDSSPIIAGHKEMYEPDGIHPGYSYYAKWLTMLAEMSEMIS